MLPINVQQEDILTLILPLVLCVCMMMAMRPGANGAPQRQRPKEVDAWYVSWNIQETFDTIVKEADSWREEVEARPSESRATSFFNSLLGRKKTVPFVVDQTVSPRLFRVIDNVRGEITFELIEVEGGGTSIKSTYDTYARGWIQNFKAKTPAKIPSLAPNVCPSCGKQTVVGSTTCPFCGTQLE